MRERFTPSASDGYIIRGRNQKGVVDESDGGSIVVETDANRAYVTVTAGDEFHGSEARGILESEQAREIGKALIKAAETVGERDGE